MFIVFSSIRPVSELYIWYFLLLYSIVAVYLGIFITLCASLFAFFNILVIFPLPLYRLNNTLKKIKKNLNSLFDYKDGEQGTREVQGKELWSFKLP